MDAVAVTVGVPGRTPAAGHDFLAADLRALEAGVILGEVVIPGDRRLDFALIFHESTFERNLGKVRDQAFILIIQRFLPLDERLSVPGMVGSREGAFLPVLVIEFEHVAQMLVRVGVAPAAQGVGVEQEAVPLGRDDEGNADLGVVLVQFLVQALVVELARLLLSETVEGLVGGRIEHDPGGESLLSFHLDGGEGHLSAGAGSEKQFPGSIREGQFSVLRVHAGDDLSGRNLHDALLHLHGEPRLLLHGQDDQTLPVMEGAVRRRGNPDELRAHDLQADLRRSARLNVFQFHGHGVTLDLVTALAPLQSQQESQSQNQCSFHTYKYNDYFESSAFSRNFAPLGNTGPIWKELGVGLAGKTGSPWPCSGRSGWKVSSPPCMTSPWDRYGPGKRSAT